MPSTNAPSKDQQWRTEKGTYYASNRSRKLAYRRVNDGPWQPTELLGKDALAEAEMVGWDRIEAIWFTVYRLPAKPATPRRPRA
jgi:hypothetical protein